MKLRDVTVLGFTFAVELDEQSGEFSATNPELSEPVRAPTLPGLRDKIRTAIRKETLDLSIDFVTVDGRKGKVRGIHASRYQVVLVTWESGAKDTLSSSQTVLRPDAPVATLAEIESQIQELVNRRNEITNQFRLNLRAVFDKAFEIERQP